MQALAVTVIVLLVGIAVVALSRHRLRRRVNRTAARAVLRYRARVDRFKLSGRAYVRERLIGDPAIADAVREHVRETGQTDAEVWRRVDLYVREIVPFFSIIAYYAIGTRVSRWVPSSTRIVPRSGGCRATRSSSTS
jgi:glycerol-3-phosphate O-acyltransferase